MSTEEVKFLLSILQVDEPEDLRGEEEKIAENLLGVRKKDELLVLSGLLKDAGLALGDTSLIKISALIQERFKDECLTNPLGPVIEITDPLANSVKHSFYTSGPDLYLLTTNKEVKLDGDIYPVDEHLDPKSGEFIPEYDPEVRFLEAEKDIRWIVKRLEANVFEKLFVSSEVLINGTTDVVKEFNPTTIALGAFPTVSVFEFLLKLHQNSPFFSPEDVTAVSYSSLSEVSYHSS
jgi:hypothetical protein